MKSNYMIALLIALCFSLLPNIACARDGGNTQMFLELLKQTTDDESTRNMAETLSSTIENQREQKACMNGCIESLRSSLRPGQTTTCARDYYCNKCMTRCNNAGN
ncbi:MAG: hypothetical protein B7Y41_13690 [Hydrogenophilales bacterium 28-61-23]|nr:MAG: hypothetical protein B7Y41_13690 [Hydrogenophilales bacterium 28-61-23]